MGGDSTILLGEPLLIRPLSGSCFTRFRYPFARHRSSVDAHRRSYRRVSVEIGALWGSADSRFAFCPGGLSSTEGEVVCTTGCATSMIAGWTTLVCAFKIALSRVCISLFLDTSSPTCKREAMKWASSDTARQKTRRRRVAPAAEGDGVTE